MRDVSIETPLIGRKKALWVLAVCGFFSLAAPARADVVTDWNELAFRVSLIGGAPAQNAGRVAAIVQAAVFDALNGIDRRYTPIHVAPPDSCLGASRPTAVVQAAYEILSKVYGATATAANQQPTLDGRYAASLADIRSRATRRVGRQGHRVRT